LREDAQKPK
jgi:hypothetical protein